MSSLETCPGAPRVCVPCPNQPLPALLSSQVMKCIVEVISDTLSKPSPMPVSQECFETLRGGRGQAGGAACWAGGLGHRWVALMELSDLIQQALTAHVPI